MALISLFYIAIIGTSIWAGMDASSLIQKGATKKELGGGPFAVFVVCLLIWIIAFPYYLVHRARFKAAQQRGLSKVGARDKVPGELSEQSTHVSESVADELKKFADLKQQGLISADEYNAQKSRLLGS